MVNSENVLPGEYEGNSIALPCTPAQFGDFLSGILASPKTIRSMHDISFELGREDLLQFHFLIKQRIEEQHHDATLVSCTTQLYYDDGRSVELLGIKDLEEYGEVFEGKCTQVAFDWVYFLSMPAIDTPQRQRIEIIFRTESFNSDNDRLSTNVMHEDGTDMQNGSFVKTAIEHSHVTLGYDLSNIVEQRVRQIQIGQPFRARTAGWRKTALFVLMWVSFGLAAIEVAKSWLVFQYFSERIGDNLGELYLDGTITNANVAAITIPIMIMIVGAALSHMIVTELRRPSPSHIYLSERAKSRYKFEKKKHEKRFVVFASMIFSTVILGALGSLLATGVIKFF